jgi:hypothetical protein
MPPPPPIALLPKPPAAWPPKAPEEPMRCAASAAPTSVSTATIVLSASGRCDLLSLADGFGLDLVLLERMAWLP